MIRHYIKEHKRISEGFSFNEQRMDVSGIVFEVSVELRGRHVLVEKDFTKMKEE